MRTFLEIIKKLVKLSVLRNLRIGTNENLSSLHIFNTKKGLTNWNGWRSWHLQHILNSLVYFTTLYWYSSGTIPLALPSNLLFSWEWAMASQEEGDFMVWKGDGLTVSVVINKYITALSGCVAGQRAEKVARVKGKEEEQIIIILRHEWIWK